MHKGEYILIKAGINVVKRKISLHLEFLYNKMQIYVIIYKHRVRHILLMLPLK